MRTVFADLIDDPSVHQPIRACVPSASADTYGRGCRDLAPAARPYRPTVAAEGLRRCTGCPGHTANRGGRCRNCLARSATS